MRMTPEAFHTWSQLLRLNSENELLALYPGLAVDIIWVLLSTCRVFTDLSATLLMRHECVTLYAEERQVPKVHQGELARLFARYHVEDKEERIAFVAALKYFLERVPLDVDVNALLSRWHWWASGCVGCIGVLKDWLVDAVAATLVQNGTTLTEEILTKTMPHPARRLSLEMEARAGEHKVALHDSESARQFQALLNKPAKAANGKTAPAPGNFSTYKCCPFCN